MTTPEIRLSPGHTMLAWWDEEFRSWHTTGGALLDEGTVARWTPLVPADRLEMLAKHLEVDAATGAYRGGSYAGAVLVDVAQRIRLALKAKP